MSREQLTQSVIDLAHAAGMDAFVRSLLDDMPQSRLKRLEQHLRDRLARPEDTVLPNLMLLGCGEGEARTLLKTALERQPTLSGDALLRLCLMIRGGN